MWWADMSKKVKRNQLKPGSITSYKLPRIKVGKEQEFYKWLNSKKSINGTITEALKLKFMIEKLSLNHQEIKSDICENQDGIIDIDDVEVFNETEEIPDIDTIINTLKSVQR